MAAPAPRSAASAHRALERRRRRGSHGPPAAPAAARRRRRPPAPRAPPARSPGRYCGPPARARSPAPGSRSRAAARRPESDAPRCRPRSGAAHRQAARAAARVSCSIVCAPVSGSSCLGYSSRDSGHRRVPAPPDRMTGDQLRRVGPRHRLTRASAGTAASDGVIFKSQPCQQRRLVEIAAVKDPRRRQQLLEAVEVRAAKFLPLGDDQQRVGARRGFVGVVARV